jgi:hypothetical protein
MRMVTIPVEIEFKNLYFCEMGRPLDALTNNTLVFNQGALLVLSEQVLPSTPFGSPEFLKASASGS